MGIKNFRVTLTKVKTFDSNWLDESVCSINSEDACEIGNDSTTTLKGITKPVGKNIPFE